MAVVKWEHKGHSFRAEKHLMHVGLYYAMKTDVRYDMLAFDHSP